MPLLSLHKAQSSMGLQMLRSVSCISHVQEMDLDLSAELLAGNQALSACYWTQRDLVMASKNKAEIGRTEVQEVRSSKQLDTWKEGNKFIK